MSDKSKKGGGGRSRPPQGPGARGRGGAGASGGKPPFKARSRRDGETAGERPGGAGGKRPFRPREAGGGEDRPRGTGPFAGRGKKSFGSGRDRDERPRGERPFRQREGGAGDERPRGERPFRERRQADERPRGERPFRPRGPRAERSGDDRPRGPFRPRHEDRGRSGQRGDSARGARPGREERVAKVIARAGLCSRRDAEAWIAEGRVAVNGEILTSPARDVEPRDVITVDGAPIPRRERTRLFLYNKPRGLVTTARDPEGRPTVFEALPKGLPRLVSIGRLDINTEGLLVLTNDGGLARVLELPDTGWLRRYRVRAYGDITQDRLDALRDGVTIDGMAYGPVEARLDRAQGDNVWLTLGLREGKNREVKRILEHLGMQVNRLIRVSFGPFQLGDLGEGAVEEVSTRILQDQLGQELAAQAQADFEAPVFVYEDEPEPEEPRFERRPRSRDDRDERHGSERERGSAPRPPRRNRLEPVRSVWRADDDADAKRKGQPRRGADPRFARLESAERSHRRSGTVESSSGRRVLVEKLAPEPEERRVRPERRPAEDRPPREERRGYRGGGPAGEARPKRRFGAGRDEGRSDSRPPRGRDRAAPDRAGDGDRPAFKGKPRSGGPPRGGKGPGSGPRKGGKPGGRPGRG